MTISLKELDRLRRLQKHEFAVIVDNNWPAISRALRAAKAVSNDAEVVGDDWLAKLDELDAEMEAFDD